MKLVMISLAASLCMVASPALAGSQSGYNVSQENRVTVYRGQSSSLNFNAIATLQAQKLQAESLASQERIARAQIAASERQSAREADLERRRLRLDRSIFVDRPSRIFGTNRGSSRRFGGQRFINPIGSTRF